MPGNTIFGLVATDAIDLANIPFETAGIVTLIASNQLQITENGSTYDLQLDPTQSFAGDYFHLGGDGSGGTLVSVSNSPTNLLTLASFSGGAGQGPDGGLVADAAGNLYGMTAGAAHTATARSSKSRRRRADMTARRSRWHQLVASPENLIADADGDLLG
jgi:hypothetical protein